MASLNHDEPYDDEFYRVEDLGVKPINPRLKTERCCKNYGFVHLQERGPHTGAYCTYCFTLIGWVPKKRTVDDAKRFVLWFGRHKGKRLDEVDDEYLDWLYEHIEDKKIAEMARLVFESRTGVP